jgi:hypothetical protein
MVECRVWGNRRLESSHGVDRRDQIWFAWLVAAAAVARLYQFTSPPDDAHEWRQTQTLMYAASYSRGASLLAPHSNWNGVPSRVGVLELPLYSILAHWLSPFFGLVTGARLVSFACGVAALLVFDRLCAALGHRRRRTATVLFALSPLALFYSHATQPESLLLLFILAAAYCAVRSVESLWWTIAAAATLAAASTIKPTALVILGLPIAYLAWRRRRWTREVAVLVAAGCAAALWAGFVRSQLIGQDPVWYGANTDPGWVFGSPEIRISPELYLPLLSRLLVILLPPLTVVLVVVAARRRLGHPFWWWWGAGSALSVLIFANLNEVHFYYQLPLVPFLAATAAEAAPAFPARLPARLAAVAVLFVAVAIAARGLYQQNGIYFQAGEALSAATLSDPAKPVVVISSNGDTRWWPVVLYYSGRDGWNLPLGSDGARIAALPGPTPCWLVVVENGPGEGAALPDGWQEASRGPTYVIGHNGACP